MIAHLLRITAATAGTMMCTVLPFLPGRYDSLSVSVSMMAQVLGKLGLLLVPVGALWMAFEYRRPSRRKRYVFATTALIASAVVWALVSFFAITESLALGLGTFALGSYVVMRLLPRLGELSSVTPTTASPIPVYLIIVPIGVTLMQLAFADPITERSRSRAIRNSAQMIADIEAYRVANGRYPPSLLSVWPDYSPSVIGIKEYRYEPSGDAYNVLFEQPTFRFGTREMVMYNPSDQQAIASHAMDVLQLTPEQLELDRRRGYNEVHDAGHPHWRYFWFD
jgi:hypothetical protein